MDRDSFVPVVLIANLIISLVAVAAVGELITHYWGWSELISYPVAGILMFFTRGFGAILAIWGAVVAWEWNVFLAILLFMWPMVIAIFLTSASVGFDSLKKLMKNAEN